MTKQTRKKENGEYRDSTENRTKENLNFTIFSERVILHP